MSFLLAQEKQKDQSLPSVSLSILKNNYERKQMREENCIAKPSIIASQEISVTDLMKKASAAIAQRISQDSDYFAFQNNVVRSSEKSKDLELAVSLVAAALNFSRQQFDQARNLLGFCQLSASPNGNPLQRVLYYFAEALQESIQGEMGDMILQESPNLSGKKQDFEEAFSIVQTAMLECHETLPFCRITQFTAIQAILDNLASARRVHLVDLGIKSGSQWPILMQALANRRDCPLEYLKITAVGSSKEMIEETGKKLSSFAENLKIPFAFRIVLSDLKNLDINQFELSANESLAVYSELRLATLLAWPHHLESLLQTIKNLKPKVMVTIEIDSNTNTPNFLDRFDATLFVSSALFDCLEVCMDRNSKSRAIIEGVFLREGIRYLVTSKGEESIHRQESIGFWRDLLSKFGMVELRLSNWALYQATLVVDSNPRWNSCTLELNGKGMIVGWKGIAVHFLTVWKC